MKLLFDDKGELIENKRIAQYPITPIFKNRWSPRAFDPSPLPENILMTLFEAARWSMSCFNEQPWLIMYATDKEELELYRSIMSESNKSWTITAPVLGYFFAKRRFALNDKPNLWAKYDCGAAWMAMTLQARMLGLYTHGMAGFDREKIYDVLGVPEADYEVVAAFALGPYGDKDKLPENFRKTERPNDRKPLKDIICKGKFRE
jgi:nitroreductase